MRTMITGLGIVFAAVLAVVPASAVTITTDAAYSVDEAFGGTVTDHDGPNSAGSGHIFSFVEYGGFAASLTSGPESIDNIEGGFSHGHAASRSSVTGDLAVAAHLDMSDDTTSMDFHATSIWTDTVTNSSGGALHYFFDFSFAGGTLHLAGHGGMAKFTLDILLDGVSIYDKAASLIGDPSTSTIALTPDGLSHSVFDDLPFGFSADFDPFDDTLDLGVFGDGDSFEITYIMEAWASSTGPHSYVEARVGDPFSIVPIPEPTSMLLLGLGLAGLGIRRARKSA